MESPAIIHRKDARPEMPIGGKAGALAALGRARLPIPDWFVVTPRAFYESLSAEARRKLENCENIETIRDIVRSAEPGETLKLELADAMRRLCPDGGMVAVRSSALDEDGAMRSFAGQLDSFLFVTPDKVAEKIASVWRSGFSERIFAYRRQNNLPIVPEPPAVLVQRMVNAASAGVAFGADPVSGRRSQAVVAAIFGLGTALVSGESNADTFHVHRSGRITARTINDKPMRHEMDSSAAEGVRPVAVDESLRRTAAITDAQVVQVAALARQTSQFFGRPQDIEWAVEDHSLYLLQSRPITSLRDQSDPDGVRAIWDNSNIVESYAGVTTPLTYSFARRAYEEVYREFCRIMKVPESRVAANSATFGCMIGLVRGRIYYNLLNWYRVLAMLPGFKFNRRFMEQMMGVKEELPADLVAQIGGASLLNRIGDALGLARSVFGLLLNHLGIERQIRRFERRLERALAFGNMPLESMRIDELASAYREMENRLLRHWDAPLVNDFLAMIFYGVLRKLAEKWCGDTEGTLQNDLLCGQGGMVSAEPAHRVASMARIAARDNELVRTLCEGPLEEIEDKLANAPELSAELKSYLDKFGDRCLEELKLESLSLHENPLTLHRSIGHMARRAHNGAPSCGESDVCARAEARVAKALEGNRLKRRVFDRVLRNARHRVRDRENLRLERTRVFGRVRRVFLEIGRRLVAIDRLDDPRDIFYLEVDEVLGFISGAATTTSLRELVRVRSQEFEHWRNEPPPPGRFETRGAVHAGNRFESSTTKLETHADGDERRGIGCCPGIVRAQVQVVLDPARAVLQEGRILVADHTDPGWIMLFPAASGLLVEHGSLLSHSAIVSREMGIASIVSITGLTAWLKTGDWVEMDGATGAVRRIQQEEIHGE